MNENLEPVSAQVLVGTAVDTIGQSGNPRTITGFQVQNAPVILSHGERTELSNDEYKPLTDVLEHIVIVKANPDFDKAANKK